MIIHVFVGLPGSGKTYLMNQLAPEVLKVDDIDHIVKLIDAVKTGKDIAISDINLVDPETRWRFDVWVFYHAKKAEVKWYFFENDVDKCWNNVILRNDGRIISRYFLESLSAKYEIPEGVEPIKVYVK